jgi:hypothetical protein
MQANQGIEGKQRLEEMHSSLQILKDSSVLQNIQKPQTKLQQFSATSKKNTIKSRFAPFSQRVSQNNTFIEHPKNYEALVQQESPEKQEKLER